MSGLAHEATRATGYAGAVTAPASGGEPGRHPFPRAAERYWLLRTDDDELRFTHRAAAERWAAHLAGRGIASHLTRHDENTAGRPATKTA